MRSLNRIITIILFICTSAIQAKEMLLGELILDLPAGWGVTQQAKDGNTLIFGFSKEKSYLNLVIRKNSAQPIEEYLANKPKLTSCMPMQIVNGIEWDTAELSNSISLKRVLYTTAFKADLNGLTYLAYSVSDNENQSFEHSELFKAQLSKQVDSNNRSLTGPEFKGKKYYFGFGDKLSGSMGNEVKYDIQHTHDIFTKAVGGNYIGTKAIDYDLTDAIHDKWTEIKKTMTRDDMYVQYSSGHGSHTGLMAGVSYNEIRDNALSMPAQEIIVFTMSCYSGNLVNAFNKEKDKWKDWQAAGRTLMVMASSRPDETSSTGPGDDDDEPNGPDGSAGSAFGHALWKALIGYSDGALDGVKDGYISLGEIREYSIKKTKEVGGHTPVVTGAYKDNLVMNKVPPKEFLDSLGLSSENLSDEKVMELIRKLDQEMRVK